MGHVEQGQDNADAMLVQHKGIAIKFSDLYWKQTVAVVTAIAAFRQRNPGVTPITASRPAGFADLVS